MLVVCLVTWLASTHGDCNLDKHQSGVAGFCGQTVRESFKARQMASVCRHSPPSSLSSPSCYTFRCRVHSFSKMPPLLPYRQPLSPLPPRGHSYPCTSEVDHKHWKNGENSTVFNAELDIHFPTSLSVAADWRKENRTSSLCRFQSRLLG